MKHQRLRLGALFAAAAFIAVSCGSDDESSDSTAAVTTVAAAPTTAAGADTTTAETTADTTEATTEETTEETTEASDVATTTADTEAPETTVAEPEAEDCTETEPGTELNFAVYAPASSLDPLQNSGALVGGSDLAAIYDVLMRWDPATGEWEPHAAESLESNDDFTEWTLKLRDDVTYSNGEPLIAQHVLDNMARLSGPGRNGARGLIARIDLANSTAPDDTTVVFKLLKPWANFGLLLGDAGGMVVNPTLGAALDSAGASVISNDPTGAGVGAYTVERWAPGESPYLVLKARADYWGGAPCIETINLISIPSDQPKLDSLELGEIDVAFMRTQGVINEARDSGDYGEHFALQSAGVTILINQGAGTFNPITKDVRFRQAVVAAIDAEQISERAYNGALLVQTGFMHPDSTFYTEGSAEPSHDPELARTLVEELKAEGWDGKIRLICPNTVPDAPVAFEAALEAVGIDVDAQTLDTNTQIAAVAVNKDFDLACWGLNVSDSAIVRQLGYNLQSTSTSNRIGYASPEFDAAIDELFAAADDDARRDAVAKMAELYAQDVPVAIIGAAEEGIFFREGVSGIQETQQTVFLFQDASITD